jgi:hypothetical protein
MRDKDLLGQIEALFFESGVGGITPFGDAYTPFLERLSFTKQSLDGTGTADLKRAWSRFLSESFESETSWEFPCNEGIAGWYQAHGKPLQAIAVYEHLLTQIRLGELSEYKELFQDWLLQLFDLCISHGLTARARHVGELIGDFHDDGVVDINIYAEVLRRQGMLLYKEIGDRIDEDRKSCELQLNNEHAGLVSKLEPLTRALVVDAQVWSHPRLRKIDPSATPLRWVLAVESEFHHKVYVPHQKTIERALEKSHGPRSCSIGQIVFLIRELKAPLRKASFQANGVPQFDSQENLRVYGGNSLPP